MIVRHAWRAAPAVMVALAAASPPPATAAPTDYQAEDATISQGAVESNPCRLHRAAASLLCDGTVTGATL